MPFPRRSPFLERPGRRPDALRLFSRAFQLALVRSSSLSSVLASLKLRRTHPRVRPVVNFAACTYALVSITDSAKKQVWGFDAGCGEQVEYRVARLIGCLLYASCGPVLGVPPI